jgi:hypothetical protein
MDFLKHLAGAWFSLKVLSSHLEGGSLDSFDPLFKSRWPANLNFFFFNDTILLEEHKTN